MPRTAPRPSGVVLHTVDLTEHTRLLGEVVPALEKLSAEAARIRDGEIAKPFREIAPLSLRVHELAMKCTRQVHDLSVSQYPAMKDGAENLALLAGACSQISLAATLCNLAIHHRTEILLYEDADPTPATSRDQLRRPVSRCSKRPPLIAPWRDGSPAASPHSRRALRTGNSSPRPTGPAPRRRPPRRPRPLPGAAHDDTTRGLPVRRGRPADAG
ncbi:hypothetical protein [Streptomyces ardesiacus]|uniref:hypothetical protein n=1 Tax=Streptomyces ardesiacus TaxID=285564 RepID=UPI002FDC07F3